MKYYPAPWSARLLWMFGGLLLWCVGAAWLLYHAAPGYSGGEAWLLYHAAPGYNPVLWFLLAMVPAWFAPVFSIVRGYTLTPEAIRVHRLCWSVQIPLATIRSARVEPDAMAKAWRLLGNGGALAYTGFYRNSRVGLFQAFVTDPRRTVVVCTTGRTYVFSPDEPEAFVQQLSACCR